MGLFTIDEEKCTGDGICAAVCPGCLINAPEPGSYPTSVPDAEKRCIKCGHCLAACPHGALSLEFMDVNDALPIREEWRLSPEQAAQFLRTRRSVRVYKEEPVPRQLLAGVIDIARYAPTGRNSQTVEWLVIQEARDVQRLAGLAIDWWRSIPGEQLEQAGMIAYARLPEEWDRGFDHICRKAPHVVVAHGLRAAAPQTSCTIALTYLELAAFANGLGACWAGLLQTAIMQHAPLRQALGLPEANEVYGAMLIGYPKYRYYRIPVRKEPPIIWR